ncbi:MAG: ABC transporter ATP-binding protein [Candidatus Peregrinibacteria bacterium]|nr:ABC transporter ATP-binding protein [Candidatus Peregrinibacteria bacterium]
MAVIEVKNLYKTFKIPHERRDSLREHFVNFFRPVTYEVFHAVDDFSFSVEKGDFVGIIGRNGSGKSTLLKLLAGVYGSTKGTIEVHGKIAPFLELGVGFNPELTGKENVYLNGTILGLSERQVRSKYHDIVAFAGLEKFMDQKLKNYSSGMFVRLAFSVAIQADADILLLDEVLAVGDSDFQQKCFDKFREFKKMGKTIVFVTHDLGAVREFCNKAIYVKNGKMVASGLVDDVISQYIYTDKVYEITSSQTIKTHGEKEVEITKVEYLDKNGENNGKFISGDPLTLRVHYRKNKEVDSAVCGIAIYRADGLHVYGTNSYLQVEEIVLKKSGYVDFKTDSLKLLSGSYAMTVAFHHKNGTPYDWRDKDYLFQVVNLSKDEGIVALDFRFTHE